MDNIGIFKTSDNVNNGINFTDIGKKLVSKTFTLRSPLYKPCDINEFDDGRGNLCRIV